MSSKSIFSDYSLESLLLQSSLNKLNNFNSLNRFSSLNSSLSSDLSYAKILEAMKQKVDDEETLSELSALEKKYQEAMAPIRMFDLFHDIYISNGFYGTTSKSRQRNAKYNTWGSIFSLQAERVRAQAQVAIKSAINQTAQKVK